uniref:Uncharacterized protein n=1 Tax=Populus trichocarpa TaxID=3694 RepID=A0A3N7FQ75_POPTR
MLKSFCFPRFNHMVYVLCMPSNAGFILLGIS